MSDNTKTPSPGTTAAAPKFTERELQLLGWAMQSLKSGPPEIDIDKLAAFAGMSNPRSASNAWSLLKKKLMSGGEAAPPNPKKARAKKATKEDAGEDGEPTPKKSPRKRAAKEPEDGDASPKKKGRAAKPKPKPKQEPEEETSDVKAEVDSAEEAQVNGEDVDAEGEAEEV